MRDKASTSEHIAEYFSHLAECLLSGVKSGRFFMWLTCRLMTHSGHCVSASFSVSRVTGAALP